MESHYFTGLDKGKIADSPQKTDFRDIGPQKSGGTSIFVLKVVSKVVSIQNPLFPRPWMVSLRGFLLILTLGSESGSFQSINWTSLGDKRLSRKLSQSNPAWG